MRHTRPIAFALFLALSMQSSAQLLVLVSVRAWARSEARRIVRSEVPSDQVRVFVMDPSGTHCEGRPVSWKEDDEFELDGVMYDVLRCDETVGSYVVHAVRDGSDTWLHAAMKRERHKQQQTRTHRGPVRELLKMLAGFVSTPASSVTMLQTLAAVRHVGVETHERPLPGYGRLLEEPPPMM